MKPFPVGLLVASLIILPVDAVAQGAPPSAPFGAAPPEALDTSAPGALMKATGHGYYRYFQDALGKAAYLKFSGAAGPALVRLAEVGDDYFCYSVPIKTQWSRPNCIPFANVVYFRPSHGDKPFEVSLAHRG